MLWVKIRTGRTPFETACDLEVCLSVYASRLDGRSHLGIGPQVPCFVEKIASNHPSPPVSAGFTQPRGWSRPCRTPTVGVASEYSCSAKEGRREALSARWWAASLLPATAHGNITIQAVFFSFLKVQEKTFIPISTRLCCGTVLSGSQIREHLAGAH